MSLEPEKNFLTIPRFSQIPFLIHGFGFKNWTGQDFQNHESLRDFQLIFLDQVHSDHFHLIDKMSERNLKGDALATCLPHVFLLVKTADCLPVFLVDESRRVIAAVHCGWKGTQKRIVERVIKNLQNHYGCRPGSLLAALGPCIGPECYEVGEDVRHSFKSAGLPEDIFELHLQHKGKYLLDLRQANLFQMLRQGIQEKNIFHFLTCTHCDSRFFSFRREGLKAGRMLSFIGMSF